MREFCSRYWNPDFDWHKWGFGFSVEIRDPYFLRLWIGPLRVGWKYERKNADGEMPW